MADHFCNARNPEKSYIRCDEEPLHEGNHSADVPSGPLSWPNERAKPKPRKPRSQMARGKGPQQETVKHKLLNAKWGGIKEAFLVLMARYDPDGPHCEECGVKGNAGTLDLHHLRRRGQGGEYSARNAALVCRACHQRLDGNAPQWSESA